jgi:hypothetical protein
LLSHVLLNEAGAADEKEYTEREDPHTPPLYHNGMSVTQ